MRELSVHEITAAVRDLCIQANMVLPEDLKDTICSRCQQEPFPLAKQILGDLEENLSAAFRFLSARIPGWQWCF